MNGDWWERPVCWLCDFWWVLLILLVGALAAFFTRDYWMPAQPLVTPPPESFPSSTRVATLGTGDVQITLIWDSTNDLDLWVTDPQGTVIFYDHPTSASGGELDVDANPGCQNLTSQPVENIYWPPDGAPEGEYIVAVNYFQQCSYDAVTPFTVRVLVDGQVQTFSGSVSVVGETQEIYRFKR
jgi:Uncharacterized protein conserved in bacteria